MAEATATTHQKHHTLVLYPGQHKSFPSLSTEKQPDREGAQRAEKLAPSADLVLPWTPAEVLCS